jgi:hypothetical protein
MRLAYDSIIKTIKALFEKAWVFQPIINSIYIFLVFHTWTLELIVFFFISYLNLKAYGTVYAMEDDPTDQSKVIMDQRKVDNDLMLAISDEHVASRIQAISI